MFYACSLKKTYWRTVKATIMFLFLFANVKKVKQKKKRKKQIIIDFRSRWRGKRRSKMVDNSLFKQYKDSNEYLMRHRALVIWLKTIARPYGRP